MRPGVWSGSVYWAMGMFMYYLARLVLYPVGLSWFDLVVAVGMGLIARRITQSDRKMDDARLRGFDSRVSGGALWDARSEERAKRIADGTYPHPDRTLTEDEQVERDEHYFLNGEAIKRDRRERLAAGYPDPEGYRVPD